MTSIACFVVMNDGEKQTHLSNPLTAAWTDNRLEHMTSLPPVSPTHTKPLSLKRRLRRIAVRFRISPFSVPMLLLLFYAGLMFGLSRIADNWIVALAITPLIFALLLTLGCFLAYRRDFYA